jgi:uncharacterized lipoprotein YajG
MPLALPCNPPEIQRLWQRRGLSRALGPAVMVLSLAGCAAPALENTPPALLTTREVAAVTRPATPPATGAIAARGDDLRARAARLRAAP